MKQTTILLLAVLLFCGLSKNSDAKDAGRQAGKPNVLFIAIDDLNDWTGMLKGNSQARTPHMDRLASKGMVFTNAHCAAPACGPSRSAIMSGIRPSTSGNYINKSSLIHNPILNNSVLLPELFQQNGYYVCGAGKLFHGYHFNYEVKGRGFDEYYPSKEQDLPPWEFKFSRPLPLSGIKNMGRPNDWGPYHPDITMEDTCDGKTAKWAEEKLLERELEEPFFLGAGIFQPHLPNYTLQKYFDRFPLDEIKLPEGYRGNDLDDVPGAHSKMAHNPWLKKIKGGGQWKHAIQAYLACTAMADDLVGQIVMALEKSKYADNTIVVVTSDHGFHMGEKDQIFKKTVWEESTRVPLIVRMPDGRNKGKECSHPVGLIDLYPTLVDLCGLTEDTYRDGGQPLDGHSLRPFLNDPEKGSWDGPDVALSAIEAGVPVKPNVPAKVADQHFTVRSKDWRYILTRTGEEELYDHRKDPNEWNNLADDPAFSEVKEKLNESLLSLTGRAN